MTSCTTFLVVKFLSLNFLRLEDCFTKKERMEGGMPLGLRSLQLGVDARLKTISGTQVNCLFPFCEQIVAE